MTLAEQCLIMTLGTYQDAVLFNTTAADPKQTLYVRQAQTFDQVTKFVRQNSGWNLPIRCRRLNWKSPDTLELSEKALWYRVESSDGSIIARAARPYTVDFKNASHKFELFEMRYPENRILSVSFPPNLPGAPVRGVAIWPIIEIMRPGKVHPHRYSCPTLVQPFADADDMLRVGLRVEWKRLDSGWNTM